MTAKEAFQELVAIVDRWERCGHALNELATVRSIAKAQLESRWRRFDEAVPALRQDIDTRVGGDDKTIHHAGCVTELCDLGNGWIGFNTKSHMSAAVRPEYEWREHQDDSGAGSQSEAAGAGAETAGNPAS